MMKKNVKAMNQRVQQLWSELSQLCHLVPGEVQKTDQNDLVDCGYLFREMARALDDMRKSCESRKTLISRYLAGVVAMAASNNREVVLDGEFARGTADVIVKPKMPKRGTEDHRALLQWLGVPESVNYDLLSVSFSEMAKLLAARLAVGENPPPGITASWTEAVVVFRSKTKKGKDEDDDDQEE